MPEDMPDRVPEDMPEHIAEDMPDRMPEDLPVTKRINVMVGITRSKVIIVQWSIRWITIFCTSVGQSDIQQLVSISTTKIGMTTHIILVNLYQYIDQQS
jgi:hypothetical protein